MLSMVALLASRVLRVRSCSAETVRCDLMEIVGLLSECNVALDAGPLQWQLTRFDKHALEYSRDHLGQTNEPPKTSTAAATGIR